MFVNHILQDLRLNSNMKAKLVLLYFRLCQVIIRSYILIVLLFPVLVVYRVLVEWLMGIELNWRLSMGPVRLFHGQGLVINPKATFGSGCTLRCNTVIGDKNEPDGHKSGAPSFGNNVDIGANSCVIGAITIGDDVVIGAGSVVTKSVESGQTIAGNPARVLRSRQQSNVEENED